ncbi:predicted protein [Arabidopsis lyrata subsp. lyrata]|uniref:Predicted protein n=1 Tax=Arabidopsis lyrata subsp. lyrata TaxID=81972 RepID=D7MCY0_ARALL|nr:predicted protein [Arabidopsis lyrata subsp. lyrata]
MCTFKQLIGKGVVQTSIIKDDSNHEVDAFVKPGDVEEEWESLTNQTDQVLLHVKEDMVQVKFSDDALVSFETTGGYSLSVVPDCNDILLTPTLDSGTSTNLNVSEGLVFASGCSSTNQTNEHESVYEGKQEPGEINRKLSIPDEDSSSSLNSSFETAHETVKNGEQISEQSNKQWKPLVKRKTKLEKLCDGVHIERFQRRLKMVVLDSQLSSILSDVSSASDSDPIPVLFDRLNTLNSQFHEEKLRNKSIKRTMEQILLRLPPIEPDRESHEASQKKQNSELREVISVLDHQEFVVKDDLSDEKKSLQREESVFVKKMCQHRELLCETSSITTLAETASVPKHTLILLDDSKKGQVHRVESQNKSPVVEAINEQFVANGEKLLLRENGG